MNIIVNGTFHQNPKALASGGEGEIYELTQRELAKIYLPGERTEIRRRKLLALCNAYWRNVAEFGEDYFAFPRFPAYVDGSDYENVAGFSMPYFKNCAELETLEFDLSSGQFPAGPKGTPAFSDKTAISLVYKIFELVEHLHKGRIILGDINPRNILYNTEKQCPVLIDLDSAQVGLHPCTATTLEYLDPITESQSKAAGGKMYFSARSDIYGLACITFKFLVGASPFKLFLSPPLDAVSTKRKGLSSIRLSVEGDTVAGTLGHVFVPHPNNAAIKRRLDVLNTSDPVLFKFFYETFAKDNRESLLCALDVTDSRHPSNIYYVDPGIRKWVEEQVRLRNNATAAGSASPKNWGGPGGAPLGVRKTIPKSLADPVEFGMFMKSFGFELTSLLS
jgi:serine/threonine protein kinase